MAELRWLLLLLGLGLVAGIYLYTRFKPRVDRGIEALTRRREPTLQTKPAAAIESRDIVTAESAAAVAPDPAQQMADMAPPESKIVAIRLLAREGPGFPGEKLVLTMRDLGLMHGEFGIFHRAADVDDADTETREFSVASLVEPGSFDLTRLKSDVYPGVSIFMRLPGARDGVEIFDDMLRTSRSLAKRLGGELVDEQGSTLSVQRERYLREEVIQFEHQGIS